MTEFFVRKQQHCYLLIEVKCLGVCGMDGLREFRAIILKQLHFFFITVLAGFLEPASKVSTWDHWISLVYSRVLLKLEFKSAFKGDYWYIGTLFITAPGQRITESKLCHPVYLFGSFTFGICSLLFFTIKFYGRDKWITP